MTWLDAIFYVVFGVVIFTTFTSIWSAHQKIRESSRRLTELGARMERAEALLRQMAIENGRDRCDD